MAVIKIHNKQAIDELQSKLILRLGRKITQQETLDLCVQYAHDNFEGFLQLVSSTPMLSPSIAEKIIQTFEKYNNTPYDVHNSFESDLDNDLYRK